eukprot:scaffold73024_cov21-Tisochrysis_lutea.AAC.1
MSCAAFCHVRLASVASLIVQKRHITTPDNHDSTKPWFTVTMQSLNCGSMHIGNLLLWGRTPLLNAYNGLLAGFPFHTQEKEGHASNGRSPYRSTVVAWEGHIHVGLAAVVKPATGRRQQEQ